MKICSVGYVQHYDVFEVTWLELVDPDKVHTYFEVLVPGNETTPVSNLMLLFSLHVSVLVQKAHQTLKTHFALTLTSERRLRVSSSCGIEAVKLLILLLNDLVLLLLLPVVASSPSSTHLDTICLSFPLIPDLVVDIRKLPGNFLVINQQSDLTLSITQSIPIEFHLLLSPNCLCYGLVLHQDISPLSG